MKTSVSLGVGLSKPTEVKMAQNISCGRIYLNPRFNAAITLVIRVQSLYKLQMEVRKSRSTVGLPLFEMKGLMAVWEDIQTKKTVCYSEHDNRSLMRDG